jgi:surface carbohydrate biosynthesis protein
MTLVSPRRWLFLPLETKGRELHANLLLSLIAAERGWGVVIGNKAATRGERGRLPRGTFLEKTAQASRVATMHKAKQAGHRVSALCEEGLLYLNKEYYKARRVSPAALDAVDYFFAWGVRHAEGLDEGRGKVVVSGNPRVDTLRPEWRGMFLPAARRIQERFGRVILVNTKFPVVNHAMPSLLDVRHGGIATGTNADLWNRYVNFQARVLPYFLGMLPRLSAAFPQHTIVIRPHPSENLAPWSEKARDLPNVKVIYEGSANEWILASDVTIQNNCSTGVEAFLLDKPAVSYRPFKDDDVEVMLTKQVGLQVTTEDELVECLDRVTSGRADIERVYLEQRDLVRHHVANLDGPLACDAMMDAFERLDLPVSGARLPLPRTVKDLLRGARALFSPLTAYSRKKFPGIDLVEMTNMLADLKELSSRFAGLEIVPAAEGGFCVYRP